MSTGTRSPVAFTREAVRRLWEHDPPRCLKDKNVLMVLGSTKNTQFSGHLWSFVIAILIGPILVCHGYYVPESIIVKPKMV